MSKKLISIVFAVLMTGLTLVGCGNNMVKKSIEQAKVLMESKEYEKAILSLEMALDEDSKNKEANKLYNIINGYQDAKLAKEEDNIKEASSILDAIDKEYMNYSIKKDIDSLKQEVEKHLKETEKVDDLLIKADNLFNKKKYRECKDYLTDYILGSEVESIKANKFATEEQTKKALKIVGKCEKEIIEESKKEAQSEKKAERIARQEKSTKDKVYKESREKGYYIPHLNKTLTIDEMSKEYDRLERGFEYVAEDGCVYMFNPASAKADSYFED
ncbi:hypothetical protein K0040_15490 [Terrisporobacter petrolearius]|uniref:hypothetical protein n=1 Tax=Terrisporobacter petrolearius TaxID=1460447 RepID=UPI001D16559A|nr:hypothetical protein [Terrisporobacter petrolearius]MCC3865666.1 hypothetical protein [Terrisporobacter petrolearius]